MRRKLLEILACPICKSDLDVEVEEEDEEEIISGKLICRKCELEYPIEDGIPNMLPPELRK
jgi:uncharacterized protein YbaR (Trm112 family)